MAKRGVIPVRGYLIHLTHYDPRWYLHKRRERPFDLNLGLEIIDAIAKAGFNLLIIDCEDAVLYKSHPELARRYSVTMSCLEKLVNFAHKKGIEVVPKLNFSQSRYHRHNYWFRPYNRLFDSNEYWRIAFQIIDELIKACRPKRFFHIGMDEDDDRTHTQYINAILRLRRGLKERGLRVLIWNDTALGGSAPWHAKKSLAAEKKIPKDIVQIVWDYIHVRPAVIHRLVEEGFEVWVAPSQKPIQVLKWKKALLRLGGKGLIMTTWIPCRPLNRSRMLNFIQLVGPLYSSRI